MELEQDKARWETLIKKLEADFDMEMTMEAVLFLIGVRELGTLPRQFSKEEKTDLMHIAICRLLSASGYYRLSHQDQDGWPHWELIKPLPYTEVKMQTQILRSHILQYFEEVYDFTAL